MREEKRYNGDRSFITRAKAAALSGIFLAFTITVLYLESLVPTGRLTLFALCSFFVSVIIIEAGALMGWLFYAGNSLLSFLIVPDKMSVLAYIFFFGLYGLIKYYTEKSRRVIIEYLLKLIFFNAILAAGYILVTEFLFRQVEFRFSLWLIIPLLEVIFIVYDYVYSMFIHYYRTKLRKILRF